MLAADVAGIVAPTGIKCGTGSLEARQPLSSHTSGSGGGGTMRSAVI
jgi:hypothetical protein